MKQKTESHFFNLFENIMESLANEGYYISESFLSTEFIESVQEWFKNVETEGGFKAAGIGPSQQSQINLHIRNDEIYWIQKFPESLSFISHFIENLKMQLNQNLFLNIDNDEFHLSQYHPGHFYAKHLDQNQKFKNRMITLLIYLNPHWQIQDEGELIFYKPDDNNQVLLKVAPEWGKLVLFRSDLFYHEVKPTNTVRRALSGWLRHG